MARVNAKVGDVFSVKLGEGNKKYFQYITNDLTQLNSDVIRAFTRSYSIEEKPNVSDVINDTVDFYAHCIIKLGTKMNVWEKEGHVPSIGDLKSILFRVSADSGSKPGEQVKISDKWYVWRINDKDFKYVGELEGESRNADIGIVVNPYDVRDRMISGKYHFFYPSFK